ncbi:hypothetical protein Tco_0077524 [Tanacetum coccineum]
MEEEFQEDATIVLPVGMSNTAIEFKDGEFQWDLCSPRPALSNIQMKVERGMRVPVFGSVGWSVGSGKSSSLFSAYKLRKIGYRNVGTSFRDSILSWQHSSARWMFGAAAMNEGQGALLAAATA